MSETIRAAIQAVDAWEIEAARSLGMTSAQVYRRVIIPNAAVIATPSLINSLIGLNITCRNSNLGWCCRLLYLTLGNLKLARSRWVEHHGH